MSCHPARQWSMRSHNVKMNTDEIQHINRVYGAMSSIDDQICLHLTARPLWGNLHL